MRRKLWLLLAALMIISVFAACGGGDDPKETTAGTTAAPGTTAPSTTAPPATDDTTAGEKTEDDWLAEERAIDLGGAEIRIFAKQYREVGPATKEEEDFSSTDQDWWDVLNGIEDDLNCKIVYEFNDSNFEWFMQQILAGVDLNGIHDMKPNVWTPAANMKVLMPLDDPKLVSAGFDVYDEARFFQPFTAKQLFDNKLYGCRMSGRFITAQGGDCTFFNPDLILERAQIPEKDMYQLVRDGKWTFEKILDIAKAVTADTDQDGTNDYWGFTGYWPNFTEAVANGNMVIEKRDGKWVSVLGEASGLAAMEFIQSYAFKENVHNSITGSKRYPAFTEGNVAFCLATQGNADRQDDYGMLASGLMFGTLPVPKGPHADRYYTTLSGTRSFTLWFTADPDIYGPFMAVWGRRMSDESWEDVILEYNCRGSEDAYEMIMEYMWPNAVLDMSRSASPIMDAQKKIIAGLQKDEGQLPRELVEAFGPEVQAAIDAQFN